MRYPRMRYPSRMAIGGPLGSGKTTLCKRFSKMGYRVISFKDPHIDVAKVAFGMLKKEPDDLLISLIHQNMRNVEPNRLARNRLRILGKATRYIIDGIYFPEEFVEARNKGFFMVYVDAPKHNREARMEGHYKEENDYAEDYLSDYDWDVKMINDYRSPRVLFNLFLEQIDLTMFDWLWRVKDLGITEGWDW